MKKVILSAIVIFFMLTSQQAFANHKPINYNILNSDTGGENTTYNSIGIRSPLRGTIEFSNVNSAYNQARDTGTTPHIGVDLKTVYSSSTQDVYPLQSSTASYVTKGSGTDTGNYLIIKYVKSGTTFYSRYLHLSAYYDDKLDSDIFLDDVVAKSGNSGGVPYHLHFEVLSSYTTSLKMIDPLPMFNTQYTGTSWVFDTSFFKVPLSYGDTKQVTVYGHDENGASPLGTTDVKIWLKYSNSTTWEMFTTSKSGDQYSYTIPKRTGATSVKYIFQAYRQSHYSYMYPKYYLPAANPNTVESSGYALNFRTHTF